MDWYLFTKFLHVTFAVIWVGGAAVMMMLGAHAARQRDDADLVAVVLKVAFLGGRVFMPAGLLTLASGAVTVWLGRGWEELWVILGLAGFALTFLLGAAVLKPRSEKIEAAHRASGVTPDLVRQCREILQIAKFDTVLLFAIIADMVLKPTAEDYLMLGIIALAIIAAAILFLMPMRSTRKATA